MSFIKIGIFVWVGIMILSCIGGTGELGVIVDNNLAFDRNLRPDTNAGIAMMLAFLAFAGVIGWIVTSLVLPALVSNGPT